MPSLSIPVACFYPLFQGHYTLPIVTVCFRYIWWQFGYNQSLKSLYHSNTSLTIIFVPQLLSIITQCGLIRYITPQIPS